MQLEEIKVSRRKVTGWFAILSVFTVVGGAFNPWKAKRPKLVKMLTQDGKLVEVDESLLGKGKKKITNKELQNWVQRN